MLHLLAWFFSFTTYSLDTQFVNSSLWTFFFFGGCQCCFTFVSCSDPGRGGWDVRLWAGSSGLWQVGEGSRSRENCDRRWQSQNWLLVVEKATLKMIRTEMESECKAFLLKALRVIIIVIIISLLCGFIDQQQLLLKIDVNFLKSVFVTVWIKSNYSPLLLLKCMK